MLDIRILITLSFLTLPIMLEAQVFKCIVNGKTVFSDRACAGNAEKLDLKIYQPKAEDIKQQQQTTQRYQKNSKHNAFLALRSENEKLRQQITQLQKEHGEKLKEMRNKTYRSGSYVVTNERGLFKRMNELSADYRARINQLKAQISQNGREMVQLQSGQ